MAILWDIGQKDSTILYGNNNLTIGDDLKMDNGSMYTITEVSGDTLTIKPWRWYKNTWRWLKSRPESIRDFWARVACAKGHHKYYYYNAYFENKDGISYFLVVRKCKRCPDEYIFTNPWRRRDSIFLSESLRNLKEIERING